MKKRLFFIFIALYICTLLLPFGSFASGKVSSDDNHNIYRVTIEAYGVDLEGREIELSYGAVTGDGYYVVGDIVVLTPSIADEHAYCAVHWYTNNKNVRFEMGPHDPQKAVTFSMPDQNIIIVPKFKPHTWVYNCETQIFTCTACNHIEPLLTFSVAKSGRNELTVKSNGKTDSLYICLGPEKITSRVKEYSDGSLRYLLYNQDNSKPMLIDDSKAYRIFNLTDKGTPFMLWAVGAPNHETFKINGNPSVLSGRDSPSTGEHIIFEVLEDSMNDGIFSQTQSLEIDFSLHGADFTKLKIPTKYIRQLAQTYGSSLIFRSEFYPVYLDQDALKKLAKTNDASVTIVASNMYYPTPPGETVQTESIETIAEITTVTEASATVSDEPPETSILFSDAVTTVFSPPSTEYTEGAPTPAELNTWKYVIPGTGLIVLIGIISLIIYLLRKKDIP